MTVTAIDRPGLVDWYRRNRRRSAALFDLVLPEAYYDRPIPLRHPFVFYDGHFPAFSFNTLCARALGEGPVDERLQQLFERGIDPGSLDAAKRHDRADWPSAEQVAKFAAQCDARVESALARTGGQAAFTILEHELMHHETLIYIVHQLDRAKKRYVAQEHRDVSQPAYTMQTIAAGDATLGTDPGVLPFAWDNEMAQLRVSVDAFEIAAYPVTNGQWMRFVSEGGPPPPFWIARDGAWYLKTVFEEIPLPLSWPAYVSHAMAESYVRWAGMRLPSEAEFHRAAFGTRSSEERAFPWGDEPPAPQHGNFDFQRYDPEPVDAHPAGASAWGVHDLIGNGWEWTSTPFAPFPRFAPMATYPQYSADFFDGKHYVLKGASPVTARELVRRSFRNWFYDDYPYMYAKFRCVSP